MRQHGGDDLGFAFELFREQRADRPVNQTADEGFAFTWTAFALEEPARDLASSKRLFLIVDRQRKEILARLGRGCRNGGAEHGGLTHGGENGTISLARHTASF